MKIYDAGERCALLPRMEAIVQLLVKHQGTIEKHARGQIVIDYSPSQVTIKLPPEQDKEKVERTKLTRRDSRL